MERLAEYAQLGPLVGPRRGLMLTTFLNVAEFVGFDNPTSEYTEVLFSKLP